jgi:hypothetical protein
MLNDFSCAHTHVNLAKWLKLEIENKEVHGSTMACIWYMASYTMHAIYSTYIPYIVLYIPYIVLYIIIYILHKAVCILTNYLCFDKL